MILVKVCSGLVGLGLTLGTTAAQQPPGADPKPQQQKAPPPNELEAAIAASANHPDVRMAQAKLQMAQAELDQAKLLVAQRLAAAHAKVQAAKVQVEFEAQSYQQLARVGTNIPKTELVVAERTLAQAKAALAAAEAEWQAARGQPPGRAAATKEASATAMSRLLLADLAGQLGGQDAMYLELMNRRAAPAPGSVADKLRGLLDKRVKLGELKNVKLPAAIDALRSAAGTDLTISVPSNWTAIDRPMTIPAGEMSFLAWLDMMVDDYNSRAASEGRLAAYAREYGLLITNPTYAPPGAVPLPDFVRQLRVQKDAVPKPEPKK